MQQLSWESNWHIRLSLRSWISQDDSDRDDQSIGRWRGCVSWEMSKYISVLQQGLSVSDSQSNGYVAL